MCSMSCPKLFALLFLYSLTDLHKLLYMMSILVRMTFHCVPFLALCFNLDPFFNQWSFITNVNTMFFPFFLLLFHADNDADDEARALNTPLDLCLCVCTIIFALSSIQKFT